MMTQHRLAVPSLFPIEAHLLFQGQGIPVYIKDISTGGASMFSSCPVSATVQVALMLMTSTDQQFRFEGTTIYSVERKPGVWETGIRFKVMPDVSRAFVMALMLSPALRDQQTLHSKNKRGAKRPETGIPATG